MIRLTTRGLLLFSLSAPIWLISPYLAALCLMVIFALFAIDAIQVHREKLSVKRVLPHHFCVNQSAEIKWEISKGEGLLRDRLPGQEFCVEVKGNVVLESYLPTERGLFTLEGPTLTLKGSLGLIYYDYFSDQTEEIKVYPHGSFFGGSLSAPLDHLVSEQQKQSKIRHMGGEFESLRPYFLGEDLRNVEWKISAKKGEMICKNREMEIEQNIVLLVDCGRRSGEVIQKRSLLDYNLNAIVQLCRLKQDHYSLFAFSNKIEASLKKAAIQKTLETIYQLESKHVESDYWQVMEEILPKLKKRSLVILFSNVLDRAGNLALMSNLTKASKKHLVLCVVMKDPKLQEAALNGETPYEQAAACHLILEKEKAISQMREKGIHVLEASPKQYVTQVIQSYLSIREKV